MTIRIERVGSEAAETVLVSVERLLRELGEEGEEAGVRDHAELARVWREEEPRCLALLAIDERGDCVGALTLVETFAIYAGGRHGIINEMYVAPEQRSAGTGARLIAEAAAVGRERGWRRIEVTAPEAPRWSRTRAFYECQGFVFAGPKLKLPLR